MNNLDRSTPSAPINFTEIFKDCWNFMRNQPQLVITFMLIQLAVSLVLLNFSLSLDQNLTAEEILVYVEQNMLQLVGQSLLQQVIQIMLSLWFFIVIHQISRQRSYRLAESFLTMLGKLIGVLSIYVLLFSPLILAIFVLSVAGNSAALLLLIVILMIAQLFLFIRLNLTTIHYLLNPISFKQSFNQIWQQGKNNKNDLFVYFLILIFMPIIIVPLISFMHLAVLINLFGAVIWVFLSIFTYRFYSLFMQRG